MTAAGSVRSNPFPGLRPFETDEEHLFFGRESQVDELLRRLRVQRFVAVVGASGSGKSSLVLAGLLPSLYGGFMAGAGSHWRIAVMRPGTAPIARLADVLDECRMLGSEGTRELRTDFGEVVLRRGALGMVEVVQQARLDPDENVLIVVDQFEELFRYRGDDPGATVSEEATAFVKLLLEAAAAPNLRAYVLITMRSDFIGDCSQFRDLPETISDGLFLVPRMTRPQLQAAITGPTGVAGGAIAPRLVARLLNDLRDDPDQLPVLQHALMRTWDLWAADHGEGEPIDVRHYEETGGLSEALSRHADEIYAELPEGRRPVAERLFKGLTDRGSGTRWTRHPLSFAKACAVADAPPEEVREVVDAFRAPGRSFLMPTAKVELEAETIVDVSHESLIWIWTRLRKWVDEEALSAQIYRRLSDAARLHAQGEAALWRNPDLEIATRWRERNDPNAAWAERYGGGFERAMHFLDASVEEREREVAQRRRAIRTTIGGLAAATIVLAALSVTAFWQWSIARQQLKVADAERLARIDRNMYEEDIAHPDRVKALVAADAYSIAPPPEAAEVLLAGAIRCSTPGRSCAKNPPAAHDRAQNAGSVFPSVGTLAAPRWDGNFAFSGSRVFVPAGPKALRAIDLDAVHGQGAAADRSDQAIRIRDAADGVHAVSLDAATGAARIWDISGSAARTIGAFATGDAGTVGADEIQLAYDPSGAGRLTIATQSGLRAFSGEGRVLQSKTWGALAAAAGLPKPYPQGGAAHFLSARGNYVLYNYPKGAIDWIVTTDGKIVGHAADLRGLSVDERYAFGRDDPNTLELSAFSLSKWHGVHTHVPSAAAVITSSPDGRMFAYPDDQNYFASLRTTRVIRLYDLGSNTEYFQGLPTPSDVKGFQTRYLAFSADGRYLLATYSDRGGARWIAVYTLDPAAWRKRICRLADPPLSPLDLEQVAPQETYVDGCAR